jgi:cyclase
MGHNYPVLTAAVCVLAAVPAAAQIDLSGEYAPRFHEDQPERIPGPDLGDYLGLPITDAARMRGETWDASILTLPEHQCKPHPADYGPRGPANLRIWKEVDTESQRVIAWHTHISWQAPERVIWMDGRPHPPEWAAHTWQGFSTGRWEGDILVVTTTHLKTGWIRRNGIPRSEYATLTEHWIRHDDQLTLVSVIQDPVYLTEPFIRTTDWVIDPHQQIDPYPCESVVEVPRPKGVVPSYLPGANPYLGEFPEKHKISTQAAKGGARTMYPEYRGNMAAAVSSNIPRDAAVVDRPSGDELHVLQVQGNVYMLHGPGGNSVLSVGKDGVLLVDTQPGAFAPKVIEEIKKLSPHRPLRYILNTHVHPESTGGNEALAKFGSTVTGGNIARFEANFPATIIAHENVVNAMGSAPPAAVPGDTFFGDGKDVFFNGEAVMIYFQPAAHTDGDSIVHFRRSDVLATGDIFTPRQYPMIDVARGGTVNGLIDGLNRILDIAVPADKQEGGTMIVPGKGRLCDEADVVEYRDMVTIIRDRIQDMIKKGMTLEQVKAARPTRDYDPLYGATSGPWTTDMFVEAVYRTLRK